VTVLLVRISLAPPGYFLEPVLRRNQDCVIGTILGSLDLKALVLDCKPARPIVLSELDFL
jgi:hypothetical protein